MFYLPAFVATFGYLSLIQAVLLPQDHDFPRSLHRLSIRQQPPNVPDQCKSNCDPVNTMIANDCTPAQCCTDTFEREYGNCLRCVGEASNVTDYTVPQQTIDLLFEKCEAMGFMIPKPSALPGQDPNRQLSTSFPVSTAPITFSMNAAPTSPATAPVPTPTTTPAVQTPPTNQLPGGTPNTNPSVQVAPAPSGQAVPGNWAVANDISLAGYMTVFSSSSVEQYIAVARFEISSTTPVSLLSHPESLFQQELSENIYENTRKQYSPASRSALRTSPHTIRWVNTTPNITPIDQPKPVLMSLPPPPA
ncbi:hypothetical protein BD779DRAFT_1472482 [Infundibulicybe gibba]|nr:hypothetical protein BD779DRAFT_1472482 [Infundibulicybe gibba]